MSYKTGGLRGQGNYETRCPECGQTTRVDEFTKYADASPANIPVDEFEEIHVFTNRHGNICVHYVRDVSGGGS